MNDQRGGIISKLFIIPAGVALMIGFFFLGYYVGKYQDKTGAQSGVVLPPLPDVVSRNLPKQDDFTFYKTLTDKDGKTVSIELKPGPKNAGVTYENRQSAVVSSKSVTDQVPPKEKNAEIRPVKAVASSPPKEAPVKTQKITAKREPMKAALSKTTLRYTVQIAAYQEKGMAEDEVRNMKKRGYAAFIASADLPGKGLWHRVRLGSFLNKAAAEKLQKDIRAKEGISTLVVIE